MRKVGDREFEFPEQGNKAEIDAWKPYVRYTALARRVLAVCQTRIEGAWCAYCDAVPGQNHDEEIASVLHDGCKLGECIALACFPEMEGVPYAH
jgi:hypothetical protein